jgi:CheY-like chemotaxis protein
VAEKAADRTYSLLLIDDECAVVNILGKGLRKRGNTTFIAGSGQEGLAILQQNRVDAVICDLGMEGMSGWDVSGAISSLCVEKDIPRPPFILLTGWAGQITEDELDRHPDVDRIVEKPVTIPALLQMISHEVRKAQSVHI